jgi:hypothetical protein
LCIFALWIVTADDVVGGALAMEKDDSSRGFSTNQLCDLIQVI